MKKELKLRDDGKAGEFEYAPNVIEVEVTYSKGGQNWFSGNSERRGYWLHVTPVKIRDGMRSFTIGGNKGGVKSFLLEVKRQSPKALAQAEVIAASRENRVIREVLTRTGLQLETPLPGADQDPPELPTVILGEEPPKVEEQKHYMKMLTKEDLARLPAYGSQAENEDPTIQVKFFQPWGGWTWYAYEYDPVDRIFFGYVVGLENEIGSFSLDELESLKGPMGLRIERDRHFTPCPLSEVKRKHERVNA